jgi:hypothetical protein
LMNNWLFLIFLMELLGLLTLYLWNNNTHVKAQYNPHPQTACADDRSILYHLNFKWLMKCHSKFTYIIIGCSWAKNTHTVRSVNCTIKT